MPRSVTAASPSRERDPGRLEPPRYALSVGLLLAFAGAKLAVHLLTGGRYGYFRDELYYLDAGRRLAFGYVDFAPLVALFAKFGLLLGGSLHAIRLIPALAGAGVVALAVVLAWQLGGGRFAQGLAGLALLVSAALLVIDTILSMNAVEPLFWMGAVAVLIRILQTGNSRLWLWFGLLVGLGLENKHSTLLFGFAVVVALLLTEHRREFAKPWIWLGGALALAIFLPNLLWQIAHHFPTLEDLENLRRMGKNIVPGPGAFLWQQIFLVHPVLFPIWLAGLVWFFRDRQRRVLGWVYLVFLVTMFALHAKNYYLLPIYPLPLAGGAVAIERWLERTSARRGGRARPWPKAAIMTVVVLAALPVDLFMLPILPAAQYIADSTFLRLQQVKTEAHHESLWPQIFADQFGWRELVGEVARIYWVLPAGERAQTGIFASNYGEAGAIDEFGPRYGLPPATSAHQNYYYWGWHGFHGKNLILLQADPGEWAQRCRSVEPVGRHESPYGMAEENQTIYLCRGIKFTFAEIWPQLKHWN
jgi:Dolichyl-phosphate-mannose-protein mannosyltransferase